MDAARPPDADEARRRYRSIASRYDQSIRVIAPLRRRVIERLELSEGDQVLDMGSGTGASFEALRTAVGPRGRVTGVELSDEMAAVARQRIQDRGWTNVEVIVGDATTAPLPGNVDGILFFLTHDLTRIPAAVERAVAAGRPGATVVALGPMTAPRWAVPVNLIVRTVARRFVTTFEGFDAPWSHLANTVPDLRIRRILGGGFYLASGRVDSDPTSA